MSRTRLLLIGAGVLLVVCAGIFGMRVSLRPSADTAPAQGKHGPFRSAVVQLTFHSRSLDDGVETLSATGHRTEYIDAVGGRRREEYGSDNTIVGGQLPSQESVTWIFDGTHSYVWIDKDGKHINRTAEIHEKYNSPIWADAAVEELKLPGATITSEEQFLGRPCKVYTLSTGLVTKKWWVWNGVTLRSESHQDIQNSITDTSEEAVQVEEDADIDPGMFKPPDDVVFETSKPTPARQADHHAPWVRVGPEIELFWF